jgi:hypothetical protein
MLLSSLFTCVTYGDVTQLTVGMHVAHTCTMRLGVAFLCVACLKHPNSCLQQTDTDTDTCL